MRIFYSFLFLFIPLQFFLLWKILYFLAPNNKIQDLLSTTSKHKMNEDKIYIQAILRSQIIASNKILALREKKHRKNSEISDDDSDTTALKEVDKEINNEEELLQIYNEEIRNDILVEMYNDNTNTNHNNNNNNNNYHQNSFPSSPLSLPPPPSTFNKLYIFCYNKGHWAVSCPMIPEVHRDKCYRCWGHGHISKGCVRYGRAPWMSDEEYKNFTKEVHEKRKFVSFYYIIFNI
jgi:hypothetical protein